MWIVVQLSWLVLMRLSMGSTMKNAKIRGEVEAVKVVAKEDDEELRCMIQSRMV